MKNLATGAFAALTLTVAALASAHAQSPSVPEQNQQSAGASQMLQAPFTPTTPDARAAQSRPLFMIGNLPVVVWAPVEPPYNGNMNRSAASDPMFDPDPN